MKTAISLPDDLFAEAERLANATGRSRSEVYATALRVYLDSFRDELVTQQLNEVYGTSAPGPDAFERRAARLGFRRTES